MSYIDMDHAAWIERKIAAHKRGTPTASSRRRMMRNKGLHAAPDTLNSFQVKTINILGIVGGGIYNAPIAWDSVEWASNYLSVPWRNGLSTFDFDRLTWLIFLCHEARIRCQISPLNFRHLEIHLSERSAQGSISQRHPSLDEALATFRAITGATV